MYLLNKNSFEKVPAVGRVGEHTVTSELEGYRPQSGRARAREICRGMSKRIFKWEAGSLDVIEEIVQAIFPHASVTVKVTVRLYKSVFKYVTLQL